MQFSGELCYRGVKIRDNAHSSSSIYNDVSANLPPHYVSTHRMKHRNLNKPEKDSAVLTALLHQKAAEDECAEIRTHRVVPPSQLLLVGKARIRAFTEGRQ